jgi:hypothetical protein
MAKQTFTTGQVLTAAQMTSLQQTAMLGGSASAKTDSYTLVAADAGTAVTMNKATGTTITVNTNLFAAGDIVTILNIGAGTCTITAGTATVSKPTNATLALVQNAGGVLYFTATGTAIFMPFDVGAPSSGFEGFRAYRSASQTFTSATFSKVSLNNETFDTNNWFDSTTNYRFTPTKAGYYRVSAVLNFNSSTRTIGMFYKNGLEKTRWIDEYPGYGHSGTDVFYMNGSTDYLELYVYVTGTGLQVLGDEAWCAFAGEYLGA